MKKNVIKGLACIAFTIASFGSAEAHTVPAPLHDLNAKCKGPQHPLNPFNPRELTSDEWSTCGKVAGGIALLGAGAFLFRRKLKI